MLRELAVKQLTRKTCKKERVEEKIQLLNTEFHKTAWTQDTRRQIQGTTNSGHDKFKLRQECSRAYRDTADANDMLLCC